MTHYIRHMSRRSPHTREEIAWMKNSLTWTVNSKQRIEYSSVIFYFWYILEWRVLGVRSYQSNSGPESEWLLTASGHFPPWQVISQECCSRWSPSSCCCCSSGNWIWRQAPSAGTLPHFLTIISQSGGSVLLGCDTLLIQVISIYQTLDFGSRPIQVWPNKKMGQFFWLRIPGTSWGSQFVRRECWEWVGVGFLVRVLDHSLSLPTPSP